MKDNHNCVLKTEISIDNVLGPDKIYYKTADAVCGSVTGSVQIDSVTNGSAPYQFSLDAQSYQSNALFANVPPGNYTLYTRDAFGCTTSKNITINYVKQYGIAIEPHDTLVCYNTKVPLAVNFENADFIKSILWSTGSNGTTVSVLPVQDMTVTAVATDKNGCLIADTSYLHVKACNSGANCVSIPSAFTPNGDGVNDNIGPMVNGCLIDDLVFEIYNRFGQRVYFTSEQNKKWNGKLQNIEQPQGAYVYRCSYGSGGNHYTMQGTLVLIR